MSGKMSKEEMDLLIKQMQGMVGEASAEGNNKSTNTTTIINTSNAILPHFLLPKKLKKKIDVEKNISVVVKEMSTLDYIVVKQLLADQNIQNDVTLNLYLSAHCMESIEYLENNKLVEYKFPQIQRFEDYNIRLSLTGEYWTKIQEAVSELNNGSDLDELKK